MSLDKAIEHRKPHRESKANDHNYSKCNVDWYKEINKTEPFCPYCNCYCDEPDFSKCEKCEFYNIKENNND